MRAGEATIHVTPDLRGMMVLGDAAQVATMVLGNDGFADLETAFQTAMQVDMDRASGLADRDDGRRALMSLAAVALYHADMLR
jgi:hypothetical protein